MVRKNERMKKRLLALLCTFSVLIAQVGCVDGCREQKKVFAHENLDVGSKIYVQHNEDNGDVYDIQKAKSGNTTVYEVILPTFTAGKAWTKEGEFVDNLDKAPHSATGPEDYVPVQAGEKYFFRLYGVAITQDKWYVPVLFLDDDNNMISHELSATFSKSKSGATVTVPEHATRMHLTNYNHQNFTVQKELSLSSKEFDQLPIHREALEKEIQERYQEYQKDKVVYKEYDKGYITLVNDDSWPAIEEYANLFKSKNIPLCLATIPEGFVENASSNKKSILDVAREVVANGGELLSHSGDVITQDNLTDYNALYNNFVKKKQIFNAYGFDVNGIILAGGTGQVVGAKETEAWASTFYKYSDLYGVDYSKTEDVAIHSVYCHGRSNLGNYKNDLDNIKKQIDDIIAKKSWGVFYFHHYNEITEENLSAVLDYINEKSDQELEVVTYKEMYDRFACKQSEYINNKQTYYVSNEGTATATGLDEKHPMSFAAANSRVYKSGDTILLKRGETYYGSFMPQIEKIDDKITTISAYGQGALPTISGYKLVDKESVWEANGSGVYKVALNDRSKFSGIQATDANSINIGFIEDADGTKYYKKKGSLNDLVEEYDFYCDEAYLYVKSKENPYKALGSLKMATKINLLEIHSNMKVENLRINGTGAHGMLGADVDTKNVEICNNIIEDIGGSYLKGTTRYGNGIELYGTNAENVLVRNNIIRNTYDVGFTMQGTKGSGKNVCLMNNVFVQNTQDSEIWESEAATGIESYEFTNNISINSGRGWGYYAREDKYASASILFWYYASENTDIRFHHNIIYNPKRIYFIEQTGGTNIYFKEKDYIKSDYNTYYLGEDTKIFRDFYDLAEKDTFISEYKKDMNSSFASLDDFDKDKMKALAAVSDQIEELRKLFGVTPIDKTLVPEATEKPDQEQPTPTITPIITSPTVVPTAPVASEETATPQPPTTNKVGVGTTIFDTATKSRYMITKETKNGGSVTYCNPSSKKVKVVTIPKELKINGRKFEVTAISSKAFYRCTKLKKVVIPSKVSKIGKYAFYNCKALTLMDIKTKKLTKKSVRTNAFKGVNTKVKLKTPKGKLKSYKKLLKAKGLK